MHWQWLPVAQPHGTERKVPGVQGQQVQGVVFFEQQT